MLDISFTLTADPTAPETVLIQDTTSWGVGDIPDREQVGLVLAAECLSAFRSGSIPPERFLFNGYSPLTFLAADGSPLSVSRLKDGVLRVIVAAVPVTLEADIAALPMGTAYCTVDGETLVRGTTAPLYDSTLIATSILGEGSPTVIPTVLAYEVKYYLWDEGLADAIAKLNLRYLELPYYQQQPLVELLERAQLFADGAAKLYKDSRFLDCASVLEGGSRLLSTGGQNPDASAPLLTGFAPTTPR